MSSWDLAYRSLGRRRTRTALTVSGIVVGVAVIMILFSIVAGYGAQAQQLVRSLSGADLTVVNGTSIGGGGPEARFGFFSPLTLNESVAQSVSQISGVYSVTSQLSTFGTIDGNRANLVGVDPATYIQATGGLNIVNGSFLPQDAGYQIVLGKAIADSLNVTVGQNVTISTTSSGDQTFMVVGIFETGTRFQENAGYLPLSYIQTATNEPGQISEILVKAQNPNRVDTISSAITSSISGVRVVTATSLLTAQSTLVNSLSTFFATIGLVALLAGSFGVVNTMLMSVTERVREIGTLKAIGARDSTVMKTFLTEAVLIGLIGGAIGVVIGVVGSFILPFFGVGAGLGGGGAFRIGASITPAITLNNVLLSLGLGVVVGVLAGLYPAWRASRMNPVEALRHV